MATKTVTAALCEAYLPQIIEAFLRAVTAWDATRLGRAALNDPNLVFQIRDGRQVRGSTARKILSVIDSEVAGFTERTAKRLARENLHED